MSVCEEYPPSAPLHPWVWPTKPWERIHLKVADPFQILPSTTSAATITVLRKLLATYGLPIIIMQVVTDNGPQFVSYEF